MKFGTRVLFGLLASGAVAPVFAQEPVPVATQDAAEDAEPAPPLTDDEALDAEEDEEIVITGQRERGAVLSDIEPELQLNRRDIRAFGASNLSELLDALAPQTRSGRGRDGGGPVTLLNGKRISGFGEIRDLPPEAIDRIDILPEEVALKYGYRADQRVVNIVLRRRFRALTTEMEGGIATAGGRGSYEADIDLLRIDPAGRWSLNLEYQHADPLFESERNLIQISPTVPTGFTGDLGDFRTLLAETDQFTLGGTINRSILGNVSATANARFDVNASKSRFGLNPSDIADPRALTRASDTGTGHLGLSFNGDLSPWRWSVTANYDRTYSSSRTDTASGLAPQDEARSRNSAGNVDLVLNGPLISLPAGKTTATFKAGADTRDFSSETLRAGLEQSRSVSRNRANGQASFDFPIARHSGDFLQQIGDLSANLNLAIDQLSDFGTLYTLGYGVNWSPIEGVDVMASVTDEDGAPSVNQLGDPTIVTPGARVFDFTRGETIDVTRIDGGNTGLRADNRRVVKLGLSLKPFSEKNLFLSANYSRSRIRDLIAGFPTATPEIEAAFPERFTRGPDGRLLRIDSRPVNFARADREELRTGINFFKPLGPVPQRGAGGRGNRPGAGGRPGTTPAAGQSDAPAARPGGGPRRGGAGGARGGGRGFGGAGGGRGGGGRGFGGPGGSLQFGLYHTWRLQDSILIREGVAELDLLDGSAVGSRGGRPRHELEAQAGIFKKGLGARLNANWQSGTTVSGGPSALGGTSGDLDFSDFTTLNLRLFADLGQQRSLVRKYPWMRGLRVTFAVDNLFDARLQVRDQNGATPIGYQPDLLDPLGRSIRISVRKLFPSTPARGTRVRR